MEKIIEELINIEHTANTVLETIAQDRSTLPKRINDEIASRTADIDRKTEQTIKAMYKAASEEAGRKVEQITQDSKQSIATVEAAFSENRENWRASLVKQILEN